MAPYTVGEADELSEPVKLWPEHTMQTARCEGMSGSRTRPARPSSRSTVRSAVTTPGNQPAYRQATARAADDN